MSRLDEIAGQGPVAWMQKNAAGIVDARNKDEHPASFIYFDVPLYATDPAPLVELIRQLGDALRLMYALNKAMLGGRRQPEVEDALSALAEFDKGEGEDEIERMRRLT